MKRTILVVVACLLTMCGTGMVSAAETVFDETTTVKSDYYMYYSVLFYEGATVTVNVNTDGAPIDLFLMDAQDFDEYQDMQNEQSGVNEFNYYVAGSSMNVVKKRYTWVVPETNTYYIVVDNTIQPEGGADPRRSVNVHVKMTAIPEEPGFEAVFAIAGLLAAMIYIRRRT